MKIKWYIVSINLLFSVIQASQAPLLFKRVPPNTVDYINSPRNDTDTPSEQQIAQYVKNNSERFDPVFLTPRSNTPRAAGQASPQKTRSSCCVFLSKGK